MSFKLVTEADVTTLVDQRTGMRFGVPPNGHLEQAGMAPGFAYCARYRCAEPAVEFRVALKQITPEMLQIEPSMKKQIFSMCHTVSHGRAGTKPSLTPADPMAVRWNADAATLAEYGKKSTEDGFDIEKCFVVGKDDHMTVILMLFQGSMTPESSMKLVKTLVNTLYWPARGEQAPPLRARPERPPSPFELESSGSQTRLTDTRTGFGIGVPTGGGLMGGGTAWDELYALKAYPLLLRIRLRDSREMAQGQDPMRLQLMAFLTGVANRADEEPTVQRLDELASHWGVHFAVMAEYSLRRPDPPFDHEKQILFGKGDHTYLVCLTVSSSSPPGSTPEAVKTILGAAHWPESKQAAPTADPYGGSAMAGAGGTPAVGGPAPPSITGPKSAGAPPSASPRSQASPSGSELAQALASYKQGQLSKAALMRAFTFYESWQVPSQNAADGSPALRMLAGQAGEWWLMLFSNKQAMEGYDAANQTNLASSSLSARGSSIINNLPGGAAGIGIDSGQAHAAFFAANDLPLLREYGQAYEVEAAIAQTGKRDNPEQIIREYPAFRVFAQGAGWAMVQPEPETNYVLAFTAQDALEAFSKTEQGAQMQEQLELKRVAGAELLHKTLAMKATAIIFNIVGPIDLSLTSEGCAVVLGVAPQAPDDAGSQAGAPAATERQAPESEQREPILPQIQPYEWPGLQSSVVKSIHNGLKPAGDGQTVPWVAWTYKAGPLNAFIGQKWLDKQGRTAAQVHEEALRNLGKIRPNVELMEAGDPPFKLAFFHGEHSSEQILNEAAMRFLHDELKAQHLAVAIPIRGNLIACDLQFAGKLVPMAYRVAAEEGKLVLTKMVFILDKGVIVGKVRIG